MAENRQNEFGQWVGKSLPDWTPREVPPAKIMQGKYCRLEPMDPERHTPELWEAYKDTDASQWTYLLTECPSSEAQLKEIYTTSNQRKDYYLYTVISGATGKAVGTMAFMNMNYQNGDVELGSVNLSAQLKKTRQSTEAIYMMISRMLDDLGYRRVTWKCDNLNEQSKAAALRYGFTFEGIFRNHMVTKSRTRTTAWFSIIQEEWETVKAAFNAWLDDSNFDENGNQRKRILDFMPAPIKLF